MNDRVWTKPELDAVWPVPGWTWVHISGRVWALYCDAEPGQFVCMTVLGRLVLPSRGGVPPVAALLAVIGQHEGRDSTEAMVKHLMTLSASRNSSRSDQAASDLCGAAEMLRRGTVEQ
jgi:hypothetical protein